MHCYLMATLAMLVSHPGPNSFLIKSTLMLTIATQLLRVSRPASAQYVLLTLLAEKQPSNTSGMHTYMATASSIGPILNGRNKNQRMVSTVTSVNLRQAMLKASYFILNLICQYHFQPFYLQALPPSIPALVPTMLRSDGPQARRGRGRSPTVSSAGSSGKGLAEKHKRTKEKKRAKVDEKDEKDEEMRTAELEADEMNQQPQQRVLPKALLKDPEEEDEKKQPKASKGGGKKGKKGGQLQLNQFTKDQSAVILMVVKLCLQTSQGFRDVQGILFDVFFLPAVHLLALAMQEQGKVYSEAVQTKGHGLTDPHTYIFGALLDHLASADGAEEAVKQALTVYEQWSVSDRAENVKMCRLVKLYKEENRKIIIVFGSGPDALQLRKLILSTMKADTELQYIQGRPPPGHMERVLSKWASDMVA